jgi:hypothetical protein
LPWGHSSKRMVEGSGGLLRGSILATIVAGKVAYTAIR